jgi:hypothetical protein
MDLLPDAEFRACWKAAWLLGFRGKGADVYMGVYTERSLRAVLGAGGARIGDAVEQIAEKLGCWPTSQLVCWMG